MSNESPNIPPQNMLGSWNRVHMPYNVNQIKCHIAEQLLKKDIPRALERHATIWQISTLSNSRLGESIQLLHGTSIHYDAMQMEDVHLFNAGGFIKSVTLSIV